MSAPEQDSIAVTGLITVYNGEDHIEESIRSLLDQTLEAIEVLVVDDLSDDATVAVIHSIADPRIRLIEAGERLERARALQLGCKEARGKYIAILDADDYAYPERFEKQAQFLDQNSEYVWVGCNEERADSQRNEHVFREYPLEDRAIRRMASKCVPYSHSAVMFRRSLIEDGINYDPEQPYLIDFEFFLRVAQRGKLASIPEALARRNIRDESFFQSRFPRAKQNRRLAWLGLKSVWMLRTAPWLAAYPMARLIYPLLPGFLQRMARRAGGIRDER